ncbi:MAG: metallopeptidase TldD-related protein [Sulfolobales archaeon]|nr:metallopeptidase TldD-related protein [Sulfolobales archaeon]MCX8208964.1 metallopeptidase TldD-related protein [Sulfolobales archaeon]MDW8011016.1 metallopeptidase TldD-related protein [Sulfolobales archaeon]
MIERRDTATFLKRVEEVAVSSSSTSRRSYEVSILGVRQLLGGCWFVSSCLGCSDSAKLSSELEAIIKTSDTERCRVPEDFEVEFYSGRLSLGSWTEERDILDAVLSLIKECAAPEYDYSVVVRKVRTTRVIKADDGSESFEEKNLAEVDVNLRTKNRVLGSIRSSRTVSLGLDKSIERVLEELIRTARSDAKALATIRRPELSEAGRAEVILTREAAPRFFHEISNLLSGSRSTRIVGRRLFDVSNVRIADSPGDLRRPTARFFDDEGVTTKKRWLVEGGLIIDAHHSIITAFEASSTPGSAHGLFGGVEPFHTSLVVERGDWKDGELFEETKRGFIVYSVALTSLEEGFIRIVPQYASRLVRGDIGEVVHIRSIRVPITKPIKILGIGQSSYTVFSSKTELSLVSETSPPVKVEAYVEV